MNIHVNANPAVSIVIPAYNEAAGISETLENLFKVFEKNAPDYEVIVVNHGSIDNSNIVLESVANKNSRLRVYNLPKNLGYGGGIMYGFDQARGEYVGFTCADEEVTAEDVYNVFAALQSGTYSAIKAKRVSRKDGLFRKITSFVFNSLISLRFNLGLTDINGYPLFIKREYVKYAKTKESNYLFNLDLLINIKNAGCSIGEVSVVHHRRKRGKSYMRMPRIAAMTIGFLRYIITK